MKSKSYNDNSNTHPVRSIHWDSFVVHFDSLYFPGASELLDKQTVAFEYERFKNYFT